MELKLKEENPNNSQNIAAKAEPVSI